MKQVSNNFKTYIKTNGKQLDCKIVITDDLILGKKDVNSIQPFFNTTLFKTVMCGLEIDSNTRITEGTEFKAKIGVKFKNSAYEYIEYENYTVYKCERQEDTESYKITAYDKMLEAMVDFDMEVSQSLTTRQYLVSVFEWLNWDTTGIPATFVNSTKLIEPNIHTGIGYTFRDVLDEIATITGAFIYFNGDIPYLKYINETNEIIDEMYLGQDDVTIGKKYFINSLVFSRAEESDNIFRKDNESVTQKGLSEFKISDNQILSTNNRADFIDDLWNYLKTLEFYIFDIKSTGIMWFEVADKFTIKAHNNTYPVVLLNDETTVDQDIEEHLYADEPEESETDYKCASDTDKKINQTNFRVDKQNQKIKGIITQIGDRSEKTTSITADIDGLSSKVSAIADLTKELSGNKTAILDECAKGELLELHIFGNNTVFNYQVLSNDLVFSDNLILGKDKSILVITNEDNSSIEYDLKIPGVLRKNEDIRDEFVIQNGVAKVIRRINDDGTVKDTEVEENIGELKILLEEGTNTIEIKDFNAEIKVKWAIKSDFTDIFTTKVEMSSTIGQTAGQIMTEVNKKVDNAEIGTKITQNYESVQIAWNSISEFIKFLNAMLQILDKNQKLLMSLDKTGMHFFNSTGKEIGNIGINNAEVSFYINGDVSGSSMSWGINKTINGEMKYFPVFSYSGYNTNSGTEFGGKFLLEAPLIMQEKTLFLGQDINSSYIQGQETDNRKKTTIGNTDDLYVYNSAGNLILVLNSSYLKLYEQLEMYADPTATGGYDFNFMDNTLLGIDSISASGEISGNNGTFADIPNSDNVRRFNNTGTDYLIAVLKSSAGGGSIYCQNANSDKKFKKKIKNAEISAVDTIMKIKHRQYDWKSNGKHEYVGYIAQELEKINPGLVNKIKEEDGETYLLNEKALIAMATKAIQEQQQQIEELKKEINKLKGDS